MEEMSNLMIINPHSSQRRLRIRRPPPRRQATSQMLPTKLNRHPPRRARTRVKRPSRLRLRRREGTI